MADMVEEKKRGKKGVWIVVGVTVVVAILVGAFLVYPMFSHPPGLVNLPPKQPVQCPATINITFVPVSVIASIYDWSPSSINVTYQNQTIQDKYGFVGDYHSMSFYNYSLYNAKHDWDNMVITLTRYNTSAYAYYVASNYSNNGVYPRSPIVTNYTEKTGEYKCFNYFIFYAYDHIINQTVIAMITFYYGVYEGSIVYLVTVNIPNLDQKNLQLFYAQVNATLS